MTDMPTGEQPPHPHHGHHSSNEELEHLAHSGEALEKLAHSIDGMKDSTEKSAHEAEENKKKFLRSIKIDAYAIPIITVIGIAISIGASTYWNFKHQKIAHYYSQASEIREDIDRLFTIRNNLMTAMIQIRAVRVIGQDHCKDGEYIGTDKISYKEKLYTSEINFVNASYNTTGIFAGLLANKISEFDSMVDGKNICAMDAPTDKDLRPVQREINQLILEQIHQLKLARENLLKKAEE